MTKLPPPEQWALSKMAEMEVAEMIEQHIDFYTVDKDGNERSVHLPMQFVRHFMRRHDGVLPTLVAYATMPLVLADGKLLAPKGLDRQRGIQFIIPDELRAVVPQPQDCTPERVKAAMEFLCDEWLVDVATDRTGKALLIAAALTLIERSLLDNRPCFFVTAGRRGNGKTTAIIMLIMAVVGDPPAASAWSSNEEERRKALMAHFIVGMPYILWDNIPRGLQISVPAHREVLHLGVLFRPPARRQRDSPRCQSTIHIFTGNNIGAKGDLASRSLNIRLSADRADPENRAFRHPNPIDWTENHRGEILAALYTILLGNPQLKDAARRRRQDPVQDVVAAGRLGGGARGRADRRGARFPEAVHRAGGGGRGSASLADVLEILLGKWPGGFAASEVAGLINNPKPGRGRTDAARLLLPGALPSTCSRPKSVGNALKKHGTGRFAAKRPHARLRIAIAAE